MGRVASASGSGGAEEGEGGDGEAVGDGEEAMICLFLLLLLSLCGGGFAYSRALLALGCCLVYLKWDLRLHRSLLPNDCSSSVNRTKCDWQEVMKHVGLDSVLVM
jgi:hypothetical protein